MKVRVLFFGATADEAGSRSFELAVDESLNTETAFSRVLDKFPQLKNHRLLFAVNQEYVGAEHILNDGDELAIFTAVSGG
ncbi:MAG TPA: MoaD/ThiS family protein [Pyrinomonadaceae bacterium]|jgi:molybdopterin converting factor subunit 1|nr:MoaD/ThiS family protein [Pyrinomonadaceae bacterium]